MEPYVIKTKQMKLAKAECPHCHRVCDAATGF